MSISPHSARLLIRLRDISGATDHPTAPPDGSLAAPWFGDLAVLALAFPHHPDRVVVLVLAYFIVGAPGATVGAIIGEVHR